MVRHKPVLVQEVMECLNVQQNGNIVDATVGEGGHTIEILKRNHPAGKVLGIDEDADQIKRARLNIDHEKERVILANDSYVNIQHIVEESRFFPVNGILADLGYSSQHLESNRGFSFQKDEALDMRYNQQQTRTARAVVNEYSAKELERILEEYGEERFAKQIAQAIVEMRRKKPIETTRELLGIIERAMPKKGRGIHYATRTFQALRIEVNEELENIRTFLPEAFSVLSSGGRLVVISFHSLEDRIVKQFFQEQKKRGKATIITAKPIVARADELHVNPRARSAKVRAIEKI